jgi:hypothetical protein
MATYDDMTLDRIPPKLLPGEREHVMVFQDESIFHTNEYRRRSWLVRDQQPIRKKGNGRVVHVSDFISETIGRIKLSEDQISEQLTRPAELRLPAFEARKITYPGKGFDAWWDLAQLISQVGHTIKVFGHTHPDRVAIFVFDRSSAHEGFAENALNIHNMNVNPAGKQRRLRDTVIPLSNPDPAPGEEDTRGQVQKMCFPDHHPDPELRGKQKGIRVVLQERKSIWDKLTTACKERGTKVVGKCTSCAKSQSHKDAERRVTFAEAAGQESAASAEDTIVSNSVTPPASDDKWCCMQRVLSLQEDFRTERPLIQTLIEDAGHICLFLPRFHCELNPIEMLWGYGKHRTCIPHARVAHTLPWLSGYRNLADGRFVTAKALIPQCLDSCEPITIRRFFQKSWRYIDAYRKGLNAQQAALANKKYKSHRKVGLPSDIIACIDVGTV